MPMSSVRRSPSASVMMPARSVVSVMKIAQTTIRLQRAAVRKSQVVEQPQDQRHVEDLVGRDAEKLQPEGESHLARRAAELDHRENTHAENACGDDRLRDQAEPSFCPPKPSPRRR